LGGIDTSGHEKLIEPLGKAHGDEADKEKMCADLGCAFIAFSSVCSETHLEYSDFKVLPNCPAYVPLKVVEYIPIGSTASSDHDIAILSPVGPTVNLHDDVLTTSTLRQLNIIK